LREFKDKHPYFPVATMNEKEIWDLFTSFLDKHHISEKGITTILSIFNNKWHEGV
jgi:hypothetical protein